MVRTIRTAHHFVEGLGLGLIWRWRDTNLNISSGEYNAGRLSARSPRTIGHSPGHSRFCAICSSLGREWEVPDRVPRIWLEREPEGRIAWLEPDEEARFLEASRLNRTKHLSKPCRISSARGWSRGRELNPRPTDYESVALPLSYPGGQQ
jgi:hypothetical protein